MKKVFIISMSLIVILIAFSGVSYADSSNTGTFTVGQTQFTLDGKTVAMDAVPLIKQGRVLVPVRYLAYALGLAPDDVEWDNSESGVTITGINNSNQIVVCLTIGSSTLDAISITKNITSFTPEPTQMDAAPLILNGRVYLPARWVVEAFGGNVTWNPQSQTITVNSDVTSPYANWTSIAPPSGKFTASIPGIVVPINMFVGVGGNKVGVSEMISVCGLVDYEVGYVSLTSSIDDNAVSQMVQNISGSSNSNIMSTTDITLSGLPAKEVQMLNNQRIYSTLCLCYEENTLWFCLVAQPEDVDVTANTMKFFNAFKLNDEPNGATTVQPPDIQGAIANTGNGAASAPTPGSTNWINRTSGITSELRGVCYGNSIFVVVGDNGTILSSQGGTVWTPQKSGTTSFLYGVTYGNNTFVAVGNNGVILTSSDGLIWTNQSSGTSYALNSVAYGNGVFVTVGDHGTILTSQDGIAWTSQKSGTSNYLNGAAYGNNIFVVVGNNGVILTSSDGTTWTSQSSGTSECLTSVGYGKGIFVAGGGLGDNGTIITSTDRTAWIKEPSGTYSEIFGVCYGNDDFMAAGYCGTIFDSPDGKVWTSRSSGDSDWFYGVGYGNNTFVIVGDCGEILQSTRQ